MCLLCDSVIPLDCDATSLTPAGLQQLARSNAWKKIADISIHVVGHDDPFSAAFTFRATALYRLKLFDELAHEVTRALQHQESLLEQCTINDDNILPFSSTTEKVVALHLLLIEVKSMTGRGEESLAQLYTLETWLSGYTPRTLPVILWWKWRITWAIINNLVKQRLWRQAIRELQILLADIRDTQKGAEQSAEPLLAAAEVIVLCRLSRLFVQVRGVCVCGGGSIGSTMDVFILD